MSKQPRSPSSIPTDRPQSRSNTPTKQNKRTILDRCQTRPGAHAGRAGVPRGPRRGSRGRAAAAASVVMVVVVVPRPCRLRFLWPPSRSPGCLDGWLIESIRLPGVSEFAGACNHTKNPNPQWNKNERYDDNKRQATDLCGSLSASQLPTPETRGTRPRRGPRTGEGLKAEVMAWCESTIAPPNPCAASGLGQQWPGRLRSIHTRNP